MKPTYIKGDYTKSPAFNNGTRLVYGTSGLGGVWGKVDQTDSIDALLFAFENGISALDTAPSYANAEYYVGLAIREWTGTKPFVSTKIGRLKGKDAFETKLDYTTDVMKRSLDNSLKTLGLTTIDLLFLHEPQHEPYSPASAEWLAKTWWPRTKEIIDKYQPDVLWFDFYLDRPEFAPYHKKLAAYYYNSGLKRGKNVVLQTKNLHYESYKPGTHMLDLERSKMDSLRTDYWQTDTSIGKTSWFYTKNWIPKSADNLVADLVDIVSENGCLLLNIGPRKDGIIPDDQKKTLLDIGAWLKVNGEAIYGSKYYEVYGEGPTKTETGHLSEDKNKGFTQQDIRFTTNNDALYASVLKTPTKDIKIKYLNKSKLNIKSIQLLGYDGTIEFEQSINGITIKLPKEVDLKYAWVFKIIPQQ